jgi:hypothetical protein
MNFFKKLKEKLKHPSIKNTLPVILLLGLVTALAVTNYKPGTILSGWDNLHPEFDLFLSIKRSIFAVWQEHQGLGLLGGMAHASDLPRQIILLFFSFFLPLDSLRYVWTFLMLFTGTVGMYFLIKKCFLKNSESVILPMLGAVFYLLNLATVQMFYVPYEAFSTFFGFLPLLLLSSILYFSANKNQLKYLLFFIAVLLLATPAWYVQTFFIVFLMTLGIIFTAYFIQNPVKALFQKAAKTFGLIFLINSFWLLPVIYFSITSSSVNINSKINQMGTETIVAMNKEYGTIPDVMLLKGFSFKSVDPDAAGNTVFMLKPWIAHMNNPLVTITGYLLFLVVFIGFVKAIRSKAPLTKGIAWLFIFAFIALCIDTPPFSFINSLFRDYIPVVNQIFRFPFTKFATLASFVYAILFVIGLKSIHEKLMTKAQRQMLLVIPMLLLIFFTIPVFQGHLFYDKERTKIPQEYKELFTFFKDQDPNSRIVNFPQSNFWGWNFYDWESGGYGGSGFLWYGIRQPIMDRNFNVWSKTNENFYFEISNALYSKNEKQFENVLNKYQTNWLLVDKNVFDTASNKTLFIPELENMLANGTYARKAATFGKLDVYKIELKDKPKSFVFMTKNVPSVNEYSWNNDDKAYADNGNYINNAANGNSLIYPFRSLFTLKSQKEKEFTIVEKRSNIEITQEINTASIGTLIIPSFIEKEKIIPIFLKTVQTENGQARIVAKVIMPEVILNGRKVSKQDEPEYQFQLQNIDTSQYPLQLNINGSNFPAVSNTDKDIGVAFFVTDSSNVLTITDNKNQIVGEIVFPLEVIQQIQSNSQSITLDPSKIQTLTINIPKIDANSASFHPTLKDASKTRNCDDFRKKSYSGDIQNNALILRSQDATACTTFYAPNLSHEKSFAVFVKSRHVKGSSLRFWVENTDQKTIPVDSFLPKTKDETVSSFILSPMEPFGNSYAFHFYSSSIGRDETINEIRSISAHPVFSNYLKSIQFKAGTITPSQPIDISSMKVSHPNESLYVINNLPAKNGQEKETIILSQSYDTGWKAYTMSDSKWPIINSLKHAFPFIFGKEVKEHVKANNWANGWGLDNQQSKANNQQLVIIYLPQYLQYIGFLLPLALLFGIFQRRRVDKRGSF